MAALGRARKETGLSEVLGQGTSLHTDKYISMMKIAGKTNNWEYWETKSKTGPSRDIPETWKQKQKGTIHCWRIKPHGGHELGTMKLVISVLFS